LFYANEDQRETYLKPTISGERVSCFAITEPGAGSDARAIRTSARKDGGDWVISGEKTFITGGNDADFTMVFAVTDKEKGADGGVTCFLVDREAGWKSHPIDTMGEWGPAALTFDEVRVPERNILGEVGRGFELAMRWIGQGRYLLPARAIGSCERLLEMGIEYARTRTTFNPMDDRRFGGRARSPALAGPARSMASGPRNRLPPSPVNGKTLRWREGKRDRRPSHANPRRHGLHKRTADRALVPRAQAIEDLRRHRRDPASYDRPKPAEGPRIGKRSPRLTPASEVGTRAGTETPQPRARGRFGALNAVKVAFTA
jgi:hypothetical protein